MHHVDSSSAKLMTEKKVWFADTSVRRWSVEKTTPVLRLHSVH